MIRQKIRTIEIAVEIAGEQKIFADINMLQTVIRNLVSNAVKFTPKGGKITVSAKTTGDKNIEISINDTGIGMNQTTIGNLFRLDVQTSRKGTQGEPSAGLGLILCKEFVEKHGGKIWVESTEGAGSTFYFTIPYHSGPKIKNVKKKGVPADRKVKQLTNLKILIAEDDDTSEKLISIIVRGIAKEILNVTTGLEAVEACRNNPDIDLILMDIKMPVMDGIEATRKIREFNKEVFIIAQTAYGYKSDWEMALAAGCNDYISKPIKQSVLRNKIKNLFLLE